MKRKLIFLSLITSSFSGYANDISFPPQQVNTEDRRLKGTNEYHNKLGTKIIIDKDNKKNLTASIISYEVYSEINNLAPNKRNGYKPVININKANDKRISHTVFKQMDIGELGVYLNNLNLANPASVIITEVNDTKASKLAGKLGILGKKAVLIVANPNGIECSACGFTRTNNLTLLAGNIAYNNENNAIISPAKNKAVTFSGNIPLTNVDTVNIVASKYTTVSKTSLMANKIVYRISNMPLAIDYNNIDDKMAHVNFGHYVPFIYSFKGAEFNNQENSVINAKNISMYISMGSFNNHGTINNKGLFYFDVYGSKDSSYINTGNIFTNTFDDLYYMDHNLIENKQNGRFYIEYKKCR
ncbi:MAG TPA: filamentous hemagglutinin N-terminal domain-containing protein [Arsenophonus apicola]|uniref:two-partner secretion domain-containing protein n=1 Tax=Arsenophonus apicola TaxID=2879119 RepID=UPI00387A1610